jgi:hypothetical protein
MNKFTTIRASVVILLIALNLSLTVQSQTVYYLPPFEMPAGNNNSFQLAGKIDSNYLLYYSRPFNYPEMYCFNSKGELMEIRIMDFIRPGMATHVNMVNLPKHVNMFVQEMRNEMHYTFVASIKPDGSLNGDIRYIDSTRYDLYGNNAFYSLHTSPDKKRTLLYRVISGFSSFQVLFNGILLDEKSTIVGSTSFYIPLNADQEQVGNLFINNEGYLFLPVYDKANNYRVGSNLRIYQTAFTKEPPKITEIYLKENKPSELILDWHERKNQLVLGGLYYNFYDKRIDGAIAIYMDPTINKTDTIIYIPFEKDFKKELKSRIYNTSTNEAINAMQTRYINIDENGTLTLLTDMFTNSSSGRKSSADGLSGQTPTEIATRKGLSSNYTTPSQITRTLSSNNALSSNPQPRLSAADRSLVGLGRNRSMVNNYNVPNTQGFVQNENDRLNQPYSYNNFSNASDIVAMNKTFDYKSVIFTIDSSQTTHWKNWARSLYVPGTPFSNVIIMPQNKSIGLLSYEVNNKNVPYLLCQIFLSADKKINQQVGKIGMPMLFYKKNAVIIDESSILTLYSDPEQNKLGLAIVKW